MAIRPSKIATVPDDPDTTKIQPSEMNPLTVPSVPQHGDISVVFTGTTPTRTLSLQIYDGVVGAWKQFTLTY